MSSQLLLIPCYVLRPPSTVYLHGSLRIFHCCFPGEVTLLFTSGRGGDAEGLHLRRHFRNPTTLRQSPGNPVPALEQCVALWHFDIGHLFTVEVTHHVAMCLSPWVRSMLK